ncbi:M24 family metallopeptidase [Paenibacillus sp. GCM10027626]|uniref:M24 family metallopeptidase n=1 Tax=Paenibacillus sp. GCM10027626 TaxID=3273411 RepID=UPI0036312E58
MRTTIAPTIPAEEFRSRVGRLQRRMAEQNLDLCIIYGDEYRRENIRYVSNVWPLFERGALLVTRIGEPILLAAPEGELLCREASAWSDIRLVPDFACVTVPEDIEYPHAAYTDFRKVFAEISQRCPLRRAGIVGIDAMAYPVYQAIARQLANCEIIDANALLIAERLHKSAAEIACLQEAARIADTAYLALMEAARPGAKEIHLSAAAHEAAYREGAENVPFCLVSSGERVNTIIGRATNKAIAPGDMVMAALAVQYEGYIATINFPFVVGAMSSGQKAFIDLLVGANEIAKSKLKAGAAQADLVRAIKAYFKACNVSRYDLYPPLHGCGVAEAESPYPNENTAGIFAPGMTVNTDISLFGHPDGSNRIEECFVITEEGYKPMSALVGQLSRQWLESGVVDFAAVKLG